MRLAAFFSGLLSCTVGLAADASNPAQQAFEDLVGLAGHWEGVNGSGRRHQVDIEVIANGTALVETWTMSPTRKSMTVYALDGERLLATHYCPQGNQPRLVFAGKDGDGRYRFRFLDGTGLQDPNGAHQYAFWTRIDTRQTFTRSETYVDNANQDAAVEDEGESIHYRRRRSQE